MAASTQQTLLGNIREQARLYLSYGTYNRNGHEGAVEWYLDLIGTRANLATNRIPAEQVNAIELYGILLTRLTTVVQTAGKNSLLGVPTKPNQTDLKDFFNAAKREYNARHANRKIRYHTGIL